jgi:heme-degrading monooxygenase HmoA
LSRYRRASAADDCENLAWSGPSPRRCRICGVCARTGIEGYRGTPGNRGAWLLWRTEGDRAEFVTLSFWESREAIEAFAGQDINTAVFYPDDEQFLIERDLTVNHYEVEGTE